jgi:hypothetical protein
MSVVRWRLVNSLNCEYTYGFDTKSKRIALGLEKTHYNDAFCIADGSAQTRVKPIYFEQIRRNNRSLEKIYDAKYVDSRTGEKVSGQDLNSGRRTRNKDLNSENLHKYRKQKLSALPFLKLLSLMSIGCQPFHLIYLLIFFSFSHLPDFVDYFLFSDCPVFLG